MIKFRLPSETYAAQFPPGAPVGDGCPRPGAVAKPRGSFYTRKVTEGQQALAEGAAQLATLQKRRAELQTKAAALERLVMQQQGLAQQLASFVSPPTPTPFGAGADCAADPPARDEYCWQLLLRVTPEQWAEAVSMTAEVR